MIFSCFCNCLSSQERMEQPVVNGRMYECVECRQPGVHVRDDGNIHRHELCRDILNLESPPISNHPPYPVGRYIFERSPLSRVRYCLACGDQVRGLRYKVRRLYWPLNNRAFHPLCAVLRPRIEDPVRMIVLNLEERIRGECPLCEGEAKGWAYNSTSLNYSYHVGCMKNKIIQSWQQDQEASENGGNERRITIRMEIQLPQVQDIAEAAIRLIIGALFGVPTDIFIIAFCPLVADRRRSR